MRCWPSTSAARLATTTLTPARRSGRGDPAILPGLHSHHSDVLVALDVSGSIRDTEISEFLAEVDAIKGQVSARITLLACDAELAADGPWVFEPWEPCRLPQVLHGGGGTRFAPVFEWAHDRGLDPDLLVYFTDACGEFPAAPPRFPVVWLVKGGQDVPWGVRIQLN